MITFTANQLAAEQAQTRMSGARHLTELLAVEAGGPDAVRLLDMLAAEPTAGTDRGD